MPRQVCDVMSAGDWSISQSIWSALSGQHLIRTFDLKCIAKVLPPAEAASDGISEEISQRLQCMEFYFSQIRSVFFQGRESKHGPSQLCEQNQILPQTPEIIPSV